MTNEFRVIERNGLYGFKRRIWKWLPFWYRERFRWNGRMQIYFMSSPAMAAMIADGLTNELITIRATRSTP